MGNSNRSPFGLPAMLSLSDRGIAIPVQENAKQVFLTRPATVTELVLRIDVDRENLACGVSPTTSAPPHPATDEQRWHAGAGHACGHKNSIGSSAAGHEPRMAPGDRSVASEVASGIMQNTHLCNGVAEVTDGVQHGAQPTASYSKSELASLLDEVLGVIRSYVFLSKNDMYAEAAALWIAGTHAFASSTTFPRLVVTSPEPSCGKSTLLKIMASLCPRASFHARATEPSILRRIKAAKEKEETITLFLDDAENFVDASHTSVLNAGFDRLGGTLLRCRTGKGGNYKDEEFDVYVPIAIGRVGRTPVDSTHTRCIEVNVQRAKPGEVRHRVDLQTPELLSALDKRLAKWADSSADRLKNCNPNLPEALINRDADLWRFMIAIADLAGHHWPQSARTAAETITLGAYRGAGQEFKLDLRRALELARDQPLLAEKSLSWRGLGIAEIADRNLRISSAGLCTLISIVSGNTKMTDRRLAQLLRPFDVKPRSIKIGERPLRGYKEEDLRDLLDRYGAVERPDNSDN